MRLTKPYTGKDKRYERNYICNYNASNCNDSCLYGRCKWLDEATRKLAEYEEAEEQGLLVRLPCEVGAKVYYLVTTTNKNGFILPQEILYFEIYGDLYRAVCMNSHFTSSDINKTVFFTEAEALQALKERE